jgi:hypothetical protein
MEFLRQGSNLSNPIRTSAIIWVLCPPLAMAIEALRSHYLHKYNRGVRHQDFRPSTGTDPALRPRTPELVRALHRRAAQTADSRRLAA